MHQDTTVCPQLHVPAARDIVLPTEDEEPPGTGLCPQSALQPLGEQSVKPKVVRLPGARPARTTSATRRFRRLFYPDIDDKTWNDWQWQVRNRIRNPQQLDTMIRLSDTERAALLRPEGKLPVAVTPYYMSLVAPDDDTQPLRRTVIPCAGELVRMPGESDDPLGEEHQSPVPGLVHRYPDRVLLLLSDFCSTYCRYCTRSRVVGHGRISPSRTRLEAALDYIRANPRVRDVLLSGGDPLTLGDERLEWILSRLRRLRHVEVIRIGTKVPAVLPQRITRKLVAMLRRYHPLWMSLHFTHPDECTPETHRACAMLADAGIPLGSQTVLLKGVNDNVPVMAELMHRLMRMRVRPYYLYQCDPISGSGHFRTPIAKGLDIIRGLRGFTSGYAVPTYVVDAPGGGGKIPLMPDYTLGHDATGDMLLKNYEGSVYRYPDAAVETGSQQIH